MRQFRTFILLLCAASALGVLSACEVAPQPAPLPPAPPAPGPSVVHTPPVIRAVTVAVTRAEVEQDVAVTAVVEDAETPVEALTFVWTADAGVITGTGPSVTWRLAKEAVVTPLDVTISLRVVEKFTESNAQGVTVARELSATAAAAPFRVHDSAAEVSRIAIAFLVDKFGNSNVPPGACLIDFSDACSGKAAELQDIVNNRQTFVILAAEARVTNVSIDASRTHASVVAACTFQDRTISTGKLGTSRGDCLLTAIYENGRWWLCTSNFSATSGSGLMYERYRRGGVKGIVLLRQGSGPAAFSSGHFVQRANPIQVHFGQLLIS